MNKYLPNHLAYLLRIFLLNIAIFMFFRIIFLIKYYSFNAPHSFLEILYAFFNRGIMFDQKIASIMIFLPFLFLSILYLIKLRLVILEKICHVYLSAFVIWNCLILTVDIPYFSFYKARLTRVVFNWVATPDIVFGYMFSNIMFLVYFLGFIGAMFFSIKFLNKVFKLSYNEKSTNNYSFLKRFLLFFVFLFAIVLGVRGEYKFDSHPYVIKDAYFSKNVFVNQLSINPIFSFFDSFRYNIPNFFANKQQAIEIVKRDLQIKGPKFARQVIFAGKAKKYNVVLIFLESLTNYKIGEITPNLNKLIKESIFFSNFYSTGQHTFAGLYSSYTGHPIVCGKNPMYDTNSSSLRYSSLISNLKNNEYSTSFFCTGSAKFDNMHTFLSNNGIETIYEEKDYPETKYANPNGVYDHVMFDFALDKMDEIQSPFFVSLLTISAHKWNRIVVPEGYTPRYQKMDDIIYDYADWALGEFMEEVKTKKWFKDTIFVLVGDHGQVFNDVKTYYPIPLSYHKVPLLLYAPSIFKPKVINDLGSQLDIFPTIMGILEIPYLNNSFGVDLFRQKRKNVYLSADAGFEGVLNDEYFFVTKPKEQKFLYKYKELDVENYAKKYPEVTSDLETNLLATLETAQYMISNRLVEAKED